MGFEYCITIGKGFLIKNLAIEELRIPTWMRKYLPLYYDGKCDFLINPKNIFLAIEEVKLFEIGDSNYETDVRGITGFLNCDPPDYNLCEMDYYCEELIRLYELNKKPFQIKFQRVERSFPQQAIVLNDLKDDKENMVSIISNIVDSLQYKQEEDKEEIKEYLENLLKTATYGDIFITYHTNNYSCAELDS